MTTQTEQALRMALDALIWTTGSADFSEGGTAREGALKLLFPAIAAIKEALAAPQGEPVAFRYDFDGYGWRYMDNGSGSSWQDVAKHHTDAEFLFTHSAPAPLKEFIKHEVDAVNDWSDWICPDPQKYLIKCCDCGLVHEAQYRVVKYEGDDFEVINDVDTQAQFRMRRSEEWTVTDTAYRPGGLPQEAPAPLSDEQIEALAVEHEAFGFGRVDAQGLTTHGFDPDGLHKFCRAIERHVRGGV